MSFSRLIRFYDQDLREWFGEPELENADDLWDRLQNQSLYATVFEGSSPFSLASGQGLRKSVKEILPILRSSDVPIIRCIGLNYIKHSKLVNEWPNNFNS